MHKMVEKAEERGVYGGSNALDKGRAVIYLNQPFGSTCEAKV